MKKLSVLLVILASVMSITAAAQAKNSEFPKNIISLLESKRFAVEVSKIVGLDPRIANTESIPISNITLDNNSLDVRLPFYDKKNIHQNIDNFSTWGRMLSFKSDNVKVTRSALDKRGKSYIMRIETYGTSGTLTFPVMLIITAYRDGAVNLALNFRSINVNYDAKLVALQD